MRPRAEHLPGRPWWVRPLVLLVFVAGGAVVALTVGVPPIDEIRGWVTAAGWAAPLLYAALYAGLAVAGLVVLAVVGLVAARQRRASPQVG